MKLKVIDHVFIRAYTHNDTYIFGLGNHASDRISRMGTDNIPAVTALDGSVDLVTTGLAINAINSIFVSQDAIFIQAVNLTDKQYYLYKSIDNGDTFGNNAPLYNNGQAVSKIGDRSGTHSPDITILGERGWHEDADGTLWYGEYNIGSTRVAGSTHDHVRILKSTDGGDTWATVLEWNTNAARQVIHCHYIGRDPYTGDMMIGMGDGADNGGPNIGGGIIRWDGVTDISNTLIPDINNLPNNYGVNGYQTQCTDLIYTENYIYNPADQSNEGSTLYTGVWRYNKDLTNETRVDNSVSDKVGHSMYWAQAFDGGYVATELLQNSAQADDKTCYVYTSKDAETWHKSGAVYQYATSTVGGQGPTGLFVFNDKLYMDCGKGSGKYVYNTIVLEWDGEFTGTEPEPLHPTYYVDLGGSNSNTGYSPDDAFLTLDHALTGDRITHGGKVILSPGYHKAPSTDVQWTAFTTYGGETDKKVIIEGTSGRTFLEYDTAFTGQGFTLASGDGDVEFRNIRVINDKSNPLTAGGTYDGTLTDNTVKGRYKWQ